MAIRALFLDFGNIFSTFRFPIFYERLHAEGGVPLARLETIASEHYWPLDRGEITGKEYHTRIMRDASMDLGYEKFVSHFNAIFLDVNAGLDGILERVRKDVGIFLISNTNEIHYEHYIRYHPVLGKHVAAHRQVLSYRYGASKPDKKIFRHAVEEVARVPFQESILVDDLEKNIASWQESGGMGVHYDANIHNIGVLENALRRYGVIAE